MDIKAVKTTPYADQIMGTSGLRKKTAVMRQPHYLENFVQSVFDSLDGFEGKTLVVGGDGRYFNKEALQIILKMAAANQFGKIIVGQNGVLSTPAASHLIRKYQAFGGLILSASHNPGGADGDFGIKFNIHTGAPAPQILTAAISDRAAEIDRYWTIEAPDVDLSVVGTYMLGASEVVVIDSVSDYVAYMQEIFDFSTLKKLFQSGFSMTFDAMNAVTGPYAKRLFEELLGAPTGTVVNAIPLPDFGGLHPEPNLTYAKHLVDRMMQPSAPDFAAASDGDGDRFMILGPSFFLNPSDALAIFADYLDTVPFYHGKVYGVARSMPTSVAVDAVARRRLLPLYETPTGWKFFGNLLDAKKIALCGEESFGAGSFHIREKDGLWAVLLFLSIMAETGKSVSQLAHELWHRDGRVFCSTHSYEGLDANDAADLMHALVDRLPELPGQTIAGLTIDQAFEFSYDDPVSCETTAHQGICLYLADKSRVVFRLSGTGSSGATLRVYYNRLVQDTMRFEADVQETLADLITFADTVAEISSRTGRTAPTVRT